MRTLYTIKELAELLAVTEITIFRLMRRGDLPYYKIGRATRFDPADIDAFLARCRRIGVPDEDAAAALHEDTE